MIPVTIRHHVDFATHRALVGRDLDSPQTWDALRLQTDGVFAVPSSRAALEEFADSQAQIGERMRAVAGTLADLDAGSVASYGVGTGCAELWLQRHAPDVRLTVTEYAPGTVQRLGELFADAGVEQHDLLRDDPLEADVHLFHRLWSHTHDAAPARFFDLSGWVLRPLDDQAASAIAKARCSGLR